MELLVFFSLCLIVLVAPSHAGFFSRRNITRRLYYDSQKEKSQANILKSPDSFLAFENPGQLQEKLNKLIHAANVGDDSAPVINAGEEFVAENVLQIYGEKEDESGTNNKKEKQDAAPVNTAGEEFAGEKEESGLNIAVKEDAPVNTAGEEYAVETVLKIQNEKEEESGVNNRKRYRIGGRRRRRRRKNRRVNRINPGYDVIETNADIVSDQRHSRDVNEEEDFVNIPEEKEQTQDESSGTEKPENTQDTLFNWQEPAGQWHLPTGQFHPISGQGNFENFPRRKRRRNNLFRDVSLKYMVYTGELDNNMKAN